jgi:hypothetical protein
MVRGRIQKSVSFNKLKRSKGSQKQQNVAIMAELTEL